MAIEPSGQQWVRLYRGVGRSPDRISTGSRDIGIHWTTDKDVALNQFAAAKFGLPVFPRDAGPHRGTVIEADVHRDDIVQPGTEEWEELGGGDYDSGSGIFHSDHPEKETTVRRGSNVNIVNMHVYEPDENGKPRLLHTIKPNTEDDGWD